MLMEKADLRVYELFRGQNQSHLAISTLIHLYEDKESFLMRFNIKEGKNVFKQIKEIRGYLSKFSIEPYLIMENLNDVGEMRVVKRLENDIIPFLWNPHHNSNGLGYEGRMMKKIENPSEDNKFIKNLISNIVAEEDRMVYSGKRRIEFNDKKAAKELFYLFAEKEHLGLLMEKLEFYAKGYHDFSNSMPEGDD